MSIVSVGKLYLCQTRPATRFGNVISEGDIVPDAPFGILLAVARFGS